MSACRDDSSGSGEEARPPVSAHSETDPFSHPPELRLVSVAERDAPDPARDPSLGSSPAANGTGEALSSSQVTTKLHHLQRMETLGALAGGLAHDFNNLLHTAKVYLQMSQEDLPEGHVAQDYLDQTLSGLHQAEQLVDKMLTFSRPDETAAQEQVHLVTLVQEVLDLVAPSFPDALTIRTQLEDLGTVVGDPAQLHQMVMNLVMNAGQAMNGQWGDDPTVLGVGVQRVNGETVRAHPSLNDDQAYVHVAVRDTGPGMSPETEARIFEPFFTTKEHGEGTGLGLSVVHGVVQAHDGEVAVATESGEGTTFHVYLPEAPGPTPTPAPQPTENGEAHARRVLVVDDEEAVRDLECIRLQRLGYDVQALEDGREALDAVESEPHAYDILLTDHRMPRMNGLELTRAVRQRGMGLPVVLVTGLGTTISETEARAVGVDTLLQKPVDTSELAATLDALT